jgi:hypothetical protein
MYGDGVAGTLCRHCGVSYRTVRERYSWVLDCSTWIATGYGAARYCVSVLHSHVVLITSLTFGSVISGTLEA